jgi:hypothetical protein
MRVAGLGDAGEMPGRAGQVRLLSTVFANWAKNRRKLRCGGGLEGAEQTKEEIDAPVRAYRMPRRSKMTRLSSARAAGASWREIKVNRIDSMMRLELFRQFAIAHL